MKVLAVLPERPDRGVGSLVSTRECLAHLARRGHDVDVVLQRAGSPRPAYDHDGIRFHPGAGNIERLAPDAEVVISHLADSGRATRAAAQAGIPSVRMAHSLTGAPGHADALVVWNSEALRAGRPGIVVHPPVHADRYRTTPGPSVTLVNLTADKGVHTFWRAAERLPHIGFLAVRGGYGQQIEPRAANVEVVGTTSDMRAVYRRTRVLLMPSAYETWGRVGVEAMASGIPVVAHPTPGLIESLGDAGTFVDRADTAGWVRAITRLLEPAAWEEASRRARRRSAELEPTHDLARFARAVEALVPLEVAV